MGLDLRQFIDEVLRPTLMALEPELPHTMGGFSITIETVWHESDGLKYIAQLNDGPAKGLGQCEYPTFNWLTREYLPIFKPALWSKFGAISPNWPAIGFDELTWNLRLAVALVRCRYLPDPSPIPSTLEERAVYYSRVYQTSNDPVKTQQYINNARRMK
jgi:hypothetical protein